MGKRYEAPSELRCTYAFAALSAFSSHLAMSRSTARTDLENPVCDALNDEMGERLSLLADGLENLLVEHVSEISGELPDEIVDMCKFAGVRF